MGACEWQHYDVETTWLVHTPVELRLRGTEKFKHVRREPSAIWFGTGIAWFSTVWAALLVAGAVFLLL